MGWLALCVGVVLLAETTARCVARRKPRPRATPRSAPMPREDDGGGWQRIVVDPQTGATRLAPADTERQVPWIWRGRRRGNWSVRP